MMRIMQSRRVWFSLSLVLMAASAGAISVWGLRPGIDFIGGSVMELRGGEVTVPALREALTRRGEGGAVVQSTGGASVLARTRLLNTREHAALLAALGTDFPGIEERQFSTVGPTIGRELLQKSLLAVFLAVVGIFVYLAFVFRRTASVVSPWAFGFFAVVALIHDITITTGFFSVYARFWSASADSLFVTALLTTLGFSVHDTIVIFNRIKANLRVLRLPFADLVERSVVETITRSVNTSMTTILVLLALLLFGGVTIRPFILTLVVGISVGTYSSIFIAAPLLVTWQGRNARRNGR